MGQRKLTFEGGVFHLLGFRAGGNSDWDKTGPRAQVTTRLKAAAAFRSYADEQAEKVFERAFNRLYVAPRLPRLSFLDPHQLDGVAFILSRKRSYLAHAPGAGKTATFTVGATLASAGQTLIIVPPGLTVQWQKEIEKFSSLFSFVRPTISIIDTASEKSGITEWSADFLIVPDSMLSKGWIYKNLARLNFGVIGIDEASRFKEITSERSISFYGGEVRGKKFPPLFRSAKHVVMLDGSPMPNGRPMELWAPVYALDPETIDCQPRHDFGMEYCGGYQDQFSRWQYKGSSKPREFKERLRKRFMHVVNENQLAHPERRRSLLFMDKDVRSVKHKTWERAHLHELDLDRLDESASRGDFARWRRELGLRKVTWAAEYITQRFKEKGESLLVFVWHRDVADKLHSALTKKIRKRGVSACILGGTANKLRERVFGQFQAGELKIIIGNIQAMGRGYNLQRADRVIFVESSWSDEANKQCEKRASRRGRKQSKFVRCDYIVAPDSMEERIMTSVFTKERRARAIVE